VQMSSPARSDQTGLIARRGSGATVLSSRIAREPGNPDVSRAPFLRKVIKKDRLGALRWGEGRVTPVSQRRFVT
jgi:hypothetical protein